MQLLPLHPDKENDVMSDDEDFDERDYLLDNVETPSVRIRRPSFAYRNMGVVNSLKFIFCCGCCSLWRKCFPKREPQNRQIVIGETPVQKFPPNVIRNQKYTIFTFLPLVLYDQFKFFLNFYFLMMAMSQFVSCLQVGLLYTYWGPLGFVITATVIREAIDDLRRWKRDKEVNGQKYSRVVQREDGSTFSEFIPSSDISVGDLIVIEKDQRVPADLLLLRTTDLTGSCFIRTDQLDGETDWKMTADIVLPVVPIELYTWKGLCRCAIYDVRGCSHIKTPPFLFQRFRVFAEKPMGDIHSFIGKLYDEKGKDVGLNIDNTLWANTVLAAGTALGLVVYTGKETRSCMNNSQPRSKTGLLDMEINTHTKILFFAVLGLALLMMCLKGFNGPVFGLVYMFRFLLLFSYIIPLSLRVNLDFAKIFYSYQMSKDKKMPGCVVRCTTIPEELGRISYLLSDKTGTLTKNSMMFKKLYMGPGRSYSIEDNNVIQQAVDENFSSSRGSNPVISASVQVKGQFSIAETVLALAVCHNVTPVVDKDEDASTLRRGLQTQCSVDEEYWAAQASGISYQASSPDEIALVSWADEVGLALTKRDTTHMQLRTPQGEVVSYSILRLFPFKSETKRMGIIVRDESAKEITFYMKGADMVMRKIVYYQEWLDEEVTNMAREGLRTLVVAKKTLTEEEYEDFEAKYSSAEALTTNRAEAMTAVLANLEKNMDLVCITGVEDKLQDEVKETLETLRSAGIKVWMLTGDKLETAVCIAKSSNLAPRDGIFVFEEITISGSEVRTQVHDSITAASRRPDSVIVITGDTLQNCLTFYKSEFTSLLCSAPSVVVCRCSPTQKSQVVELIRKHTKKRTAAIGDGGNDVSMIQAADVGIGIAGKEGKQASLAADFSITEFKSLLSLFLIHGRWSYKRSATLSQFVIHRGIIISVMQAIYSIVFYFSSVSLFPAPFMVGYATLFTMFPVFSLVLNKDFKEDGWALKYPLLYKDLAKGRALSYKTFFLWVLVSVIQGGVIMYGTIYLFNDEMLHMVSIAFTALILTELIMVALTVTTWHYLIIVAELLSLGLYFLSLFVFRSYFDPQFLGTWDFVWKVLTITVFSCLPLIMGKVMCWWLSPSVYSKLS